MGNPPTKIKTMTIGLIDVDGHNFPNLALMKLSAYHKQMGDNVDWYNIFDFYDRVYMSKVFTHTPDFCQIISNAKEIVRGGDRLRFSKPFANRSRKDNSRLFNLSVY